MKPRTTIHSGQTTILIAALSFLMSGCAVTEQFIADTVEQIRDLDYFLGNKELKDNQAEAPRQEKQPDNYTSVSLSPAVANAANSDLSRACLNIPDPKFSYRKKVALLSFDIENPHQVVDLNRIHTKLPRVLGQRLNRESFVVIDATNERSPNTTNHTELDIPSFIRHIAQKYNSQFVVAGVINGAAHTGETHSTLARLRARLPGQKAIQNRELEMTLTVFDGATGVVIDESYYNGMAKDPLSMRGKTDVLADIPHEGNYAHLIDTYLNYQSSWLADTLTCLPMQASVTSVTGSAITFATGTESLILPGDTLKLLRRIQLQHTLDGEPHYRYEENGQVTITQVYPNGALARFSGSSPPYQVNQGDIVQAW